MTDVYSSGRTVHHGGVGIMELPQTVNGSRYVKSLLIISPSGLNHFLWITKQMRPL